MKGRSERGFESYLVEYLNTLALYGSIVTSNLHAVNMLARSSCERVVSLRQSFRNALFSPIGED